MMRNSLSARWPVLGVVWIVRPIELNDVFFLIRQSWWEWLASTEARQGPRRMAAAKTAPDGFTMLTSGGMDSTQFRGMSLQITLCRDPAHADGPLSGGDAALARGGRHRGCGDNALNFIARSPDGLRSVVRVVLPSRVLLSCHDLSINFVQLHHRAWMCSLVCPVMDCEQRK